jgi:Fe-S cluster biosynthesis and repair protein YggX
LVYTPSEDGRRLLDELQKEKYENWTPQITFTMWVKYIKVSNEDSKTELRVTKIE